MSASLGPNSPQRIPDDAYTTPAWAVWAAMPRVDEVMFGSPSPARIRVVDAGCGSGAISKVIAEHRPTAQLIGVDVRPVQSDYLAAVPGAEFVHADFLQCDLHAVDLVVMNPPFKLGMEFVQHALEQTGGPNGMAHGKVIALLRLNWLASQGRAPFFREHPPHVAVLPRRPGFLPDKPSKTDGTEYAWFCWGISSGTWSLLHTRPAECHVARKRER